MCSIPLLILRYTSFVFLLYLWLPLRAEAAGGYPGYFLGQGGGARGLAMGRANVALSDDASAVLWNPAAMSRLRQNELTFLHAMLFEDTRFDYIGYVQADRALHPWTFGVGAAQVYAGGFIKRDATNTETGTFADSQSAFFLSASLSPDSQFPLSVGTSVRMLYKQIDVLTATGFGVDVSAYVAPIEFIGLGVNVQNVVATPLSRGQGTETPPLSILGGAAAWLLDNALIVSCMLEKIGSDPVAIRGGVEGSIIPSLGLRAGWDQGYLTGGFGLRVDEWAFDYALLNHPDLGFSHRASASVRFGTDRMEAEKTERAHGTRAETLFLEGLGFFNRQMWTEASKAFQGALRNDEQHVLARQKYGEIKRRLSGSQPRLAVLDFQGDLREIASVTAINKYATGVFAAIKTVTTVEPADVDAAFKAKQMDRGLCTSVECAVDIGKALKIPWVIMGAVTRTDDGLAVKGQAVSMETGLVMATRVVKHRRGDDPQGILRELAADLVRQLTE